MKNVDDKPKMSGSMKYIEIEFPKDEGDHYKDKVHRYMVPEKYKQWYEWWYFNGKLMTTDKREFGYMVAIFHYTVKDPLNDDNRILIADGNMLISDLENKKSYFSAWPLWSTDPEYSNDTKSSSNLSVLHSLNFNKEKLDIKIMGYPIGTGKFKKVAEKVIGGSEFDDAMDETAIDKDNFFKFSSHSPSIPGNIIEKKGDKKYVIKTKGRAIIEPGRDIEDAKGNIIKKEDFDKIVTEYYENIRNNENDFKKIVNKCIDAIKMRNPNMLKDEIPKKAEEVADKDIKKQARKKAFNEIHYKYSDMGLDLTLELDMEPLLINGHGILNMPDLGDSYYYTFPHLETVGKITVGKETFTIDSGDSWMDHQWGDFDVDTEKSGWEWFSLRLRSKDDEKYRIYANVFIHVDQDHNVVGSDKADSVASFFMPDGSRPVLKLKENLSETGEDGFFSVTKVKKTEDGAWKYDEDELSDYTGINKDYKGKIYPQKFEFDFRIEGKKLAVVLESVFKHQFGFYYWEGFSNVTAEWKDGEELTGFSFTEIIYPKNPKKEENVG